MIRNIVFDMGNVVIRFDPVYFLDRAGITDPEDRKPLDEYVLKADELMYSQKKAKKNRS